MIAFVGFNATQKAKVAGDWYVLHDMLRQTAIKRLVEYIAKQYPNCTKDQMVEYIIDYIRKDLNEIIKEVK